MIRKSASRISPRPETSFIGNPRSRWRKDSIEPFNSLKRNPENKFEITASRSTQCGVHSFSTLFCGLGRFCSLSVIPERPYLDYDEAVHAGAGIIGYDFVQDQWHHTNYCARSFHYFNAGLIYWPFLHGVLLGFWHLIFGLGARQAIGFSILIACLTLLSLFRMGYRQFGAAPAMAGCVILSLYAPFLISSRTVMHDMIQFLAAIWMLHYFINQSDALYEGRKLDHLWRRLFRSFAFSPLLGSPA